MEIEDEAGHRKRVIWWRGAAADLPSGRFDLAYTLRTSTFKGQREALVEWLDYRALSTALPDLQSAEPTYDLIDFRGSGLPQSDLEAVFAPYPNCLIWSEADKVEGAVDRLHLQSAETLVVWTAPASAEIWSAALATVDPARLILIGTLPAGEKTNGFLERLAGLVKYAISSRGGTVGLEELAAALGQRERAVQVGLQVLGALGKLDCRVTESGLYQLELVDRAPQDDVDKWLERLDLLLREARAYRSYWLTMEIGG